MITYKFDKIDLHTTEYIFRFTISIISFIFYVFTLCPTVDFIDSGELAAVASTLGVAHPTGYPLFTLIGWVFAHLPLGLRTIYQLNLMSAFFCSLGLFFFFRFLVLIISETLQRGAKGKIFKNSTVTEYYLFYVFIPAMFGTIVLAFSETYWSQALSVEVYSLHVLFLSILLYLFTKAAHLELEEKDKSVSSKSVWRYWCVFAFVLGLSFTNHMTTILLAPAFISLYFYVHGFSQQVIKKTLWLGIPFIIGFSVYLYLPIRASQHPLMNWGNPIDLEKFLWHFSGKVYRVWIFSSTESAAKQFNYFIDTLPREFVYFPLLFSLTGLWHLFKYFKRGLVFTLLLFLTCLLYSINYDIHDIDSYFLLAYFMIALWSGVGSYQLIIWLKNKRVIKIATLTLFVAITILIYINYQEVNKSEHHLVEEYSLDMLKSIAPDGIVISYQWDYFISAAYYLQMVEKVRPDVVVIDKELLRRSWYYNQLRNNYPWLMMQIQTEVDVFLRELKKFEHDEPYNSNIIEYHYTKVIRSIIDKNLSTRPIYVTAEIESQYLSGYNRVPSGLALRLYTDTLTHETPKIDFNFNIPDKNDIYTDGLLSLYARAYMNNAIYSNLVGKKQQAELYLDRALEIKPDIREAILLREKLKKNSEKKLTIDEKSLIIK
ncbi:MAG: DUF2723 domain-containing protein [Bacteroidota bacterium]|nr:DUF2723 domain-containing protein [Bacteroidota bacterium]